MSVSLSDNDEFVIGGSGTQSWSGSIAAAKFGDHKLADTPHCTMEDVENDKDTKKRCGKLSQTQDSYGGAATLILNNISGYQGETVYVSGMPGDNGYGSVRFYRKES